MKTAYVYAASCGNGNCQPTQGENCATCPADCGVCPTPTTPSGPTPTTPSGPTPTSGPSTPSSDTSTTTTNQSTQTTRKFYPSVNFSPPVLQFTNSPLITFSGDATIEEGTVDRVEYNIDQGQWKKEQVKNNRFSFIANLNEGKHKITARAVSLAGIASAENTQTFTVVLTPPEIAIKQFQEQTKNQIINFRATVTSKFGKINRVEISTDGSKTWKTMQSLGKNQYGLMSEKLDDGNYSIIIRAFDNTGNSSETGQKKLVVDTIPPIIGGAELSTGPQILVPNPQGKIRIPTGLKINIRLSMKGGVEEASAKIGEQSFALTNISGTNQWKGILKLDKPQENYIEILAIDGAQNKSSRKLGKIIVENYGQIANIKNKLPVKDAYISVYFFSDILKNWILWDGQSYGQQNPQKTNVEGVYSFMLPKGKFYMEVKALGYKPSQSEIFENKETTIINTNIKLEPIRLTEKIKKILFGILPPNTFFIKNFTTTTTTPEILKNKIDFGPIPIIRGKKTLITFFSLWSTLCQEQIKILDDLNKDLSENENILGISLQESTTRTSLFMKTGGYKFPVWTDQNGNTADKFDISFLPQHIFVDAKGNIVSILNGIVDKQTIIDILEKIK